METNRTALLIMDMQMGFLASLPDQGKLLRRNIAAAINTARQKHILVIFVRLGFQKGLPEISPANAMFFGLKNHLSNDDALGAFMEIPADLGITTSDIVINKKRVSAFSGSELEMILRASNISDLVLTGISTGGMVLSTFTEAFDKDYQLTVLTDCCSDPDEELHQLLLNKIFSKRGLVVTAAQWNEY
ncbi:Nicotinamidase-related amidase [Pedobacter westerhofensis]|uniref:Nicotinamidase-related amidase n=1 Tax=Pedobacter westerhofensis TaxID=425512 RepID=A0A521E5P3_9SPHI|nr:isochorismatase family cysteine hydrolase [Pedobacter westerhofensis]SMO78691.1 Nicotinamidase-related amidase [Pedobacter westerhofensis]